MKYILALVALSLVSISSVAQEIGSNKIPAVNFHCEDAGPVRDFCQKLEQQTKEEDSDLKRVRLSGLSKRQKPLKISTLTPTAILPQKK